MTNDSPIIFLLVQTPLLWWLILYFVLYRHELTRIRHPIKEKNRLKDWVEVFSNLKLISTIPPSLEKKLMDEDTERTKNKVIIILAFLVVWLTAVLIPKIIVVPYFQHPFLQDILFPFLLQLFPALVLIFVTYRYCGQLPEKPHKYHLNRLRKGSLLRHLEVDGEN